MRRAAWAGLFQSLVLSACGGEIVLIDASSEAMVGNDANVLSPLDASEEDSALPWIDISECSIRADQCAWLYDLGCVLAKFGITDGGTLSEDDLKRITNVQMKTPCAVENGHVRCGFYCPGGRPPTNVVIDGAPHDFSTVAGFFAESAVLEAASVLGFAELARTLAFHGAPTRLVTWALRSVREERRHAKVMTRHARRRGLTPRRVRAHPSPVPSLYDLARDNLVEGCVVEAYSALVLVWLSKYATLHLRSTFRTIAKDEVAHAGLAFEIHRWARSKLDADARRRLDVAKTHAMDTLVRGTSHPPSPELGALGMPPVAVARALVQRLAAVHAFLA